MNRRKFGILGAGVIVLLVALMLIFGCAAPSPTPTLPKPDIKVGHIVDLTGPTAVLGRDTRDATVDFTNYINDKGGIKGHKIRLITVDCSYDQDKEIIAYRRLMDVEKVNWFYGHHSTVQFRLRHELIDKGFMAYGSPDIKNLIPPSNTFNPDATYLDQNLAIMKWAAKTMGTPSRPARIAYYCVEGHHSQTYIRAMKDSAPEIGVELVKTYVSPGSKRDFEATILENIKDNIDLVLTHTTETQLILWVKDAARLGYKGKQLHRTLTAGLIPMIGKDLAQGMYGVYTTATFEETEVPGIKLAWEFQKKYHPEFLDTGRGSWYARYAAIVLLAQQVAEQVIKEKGFENLNGNNIVKVLESGREFTAMGLIPPFHFTKEYHGGMPTSIKIGQVKGEKIVTVTDWIESSPRTSQQLTLDYYK